MIPDYIQDAIYDKVDLFIFHATEEGQGDNLSIGLLGFGEIAGFVSVSFAIERMEMEWYEMDAAFDTSLRHLPYKLVPVYPEHLQIQADYIEMPGMFAISGDRWGEDRLDIREGSGISGGYLLTSPLNLIYLS